MTAQFPALSLESMARIRKACDHAGVALVKQIEIRSRDPQLYLIVIDCTDEQEKIIDEVAKEEFFK
jgi:hypothetical protein